jgi:MoaA/NifB/PqqE/SkfB family radical SAM enzyme
VLPVVVELNPTELCNLQCNFCPRSQDYPNSNYHMSLETVNVVIDHLHELREKLPKNKQLIVSNTGRGEPVLHKFFRPTMERLIEFSNQYGPSVQILVNTNGYKFDDHLDIFLQTDRVFFNVYYNYSYNEYEQFKDKYSQYGNIDVKRRKEGEESEKVNYNSRSGAILVNNLTDVISTDKSYGFCGKPFLNTFIDWNGDYILCCNDWVIMEKLDNVHQTSIVDYYNTNPKLQSYKKMLLNRRRTMAPCVTCNYFDRTK